MSYKKPQATLIDTTELCEYGCNSRAKYVFANGKKCCAKHQNSCQGKRNAFSKLDHTQRTNKSLETRTRLGITKSSQIKGSATRREQGHYDKLANTMRDHWEKNPWNNNLHCPLVEFKSTSVLYQGTFEFEFLEKLEIEYGLEWVNSNVKRGPAFRYIDPSDSKEKLYISDFIIDNTIYEIKSGWTWNKHGKDMALERKNKAKLTSCIQQGYNVVLVLNQQRLQYEEVMD